MINLRSLLGIKLLRFAIVGGVATVVYTLSMATLVELISVLPVTAAVISYCLSITTSYLANHRWTFRASGNHVTYLPRYLLVSGLALCINVAITYTIVNVLEIWYGFSVALVVVVVPLFTFSLNHGWTFNFSERT